LDDARVLAVLDSLGEAAPPETWDDWQLAQAAWTLRPERTRTQAELAGVRAARVTAGARAEPGVATEWEYSFSGTEGESRWGIALGSVFNLELGGKRAARIARATAMELLVRARGEEEGWEVRWRVREAAWHRVVSQRLVLALETERDVLDTLLEASRQRYAEGVLGRLEVARVEAERQRLESELASRRREREEAEAALATAVGVPVVELGRVRAPFRSGAACADSAQRDRLQRLALDRRWRLREALAAYQVAEADLRQEVARSWPTLQLGPGLFFDHGVGKWTVLFGLPALPVNRNRGPIAEAEARRAVAAERVTEVQELILGEVDFALAGCRAAERSRPAFDPGPARNRLSLAEEAWSRGETGRLDLILARLEVARLERLGIEAVTRLEQAALGLERAAGIWSRPPATPDPKGGE
jgi:outer membrane protein TolC